MPQSSIVPFEPVAPVVSLQVLPLEVAPIKNFSSVAAIFPLTPQAQQMLKSNGFVVVQQDQPVGSFDDMLAAYRYVKNNQLPLFITADSLLHLFHLQFDETLKHIEQEKLFDLLWQLNLTLLEKSRLDYESTTGDAQAAARLNMAYCAVALELLRPKSEQLPDEPLATPGKPAENPLFEQLKQRLQKSFFLADKQKYSVHIPAPVTTIVAQELELIQAHAGFRKSPIFGYEEDYSQYVPRGHYTYSDKLANYFRAFMWAGRLTRLLKDDLFRNAPPQAYIQTLSACLFTQHLVSDPELLRKWNALYEVTALYVGYSDDWGPREYDVVMKQLWPDGFTSMAFTHQMFEKLKRMLIENYPLPQIYGGTGACMADPKTARMQDLDRCLASTAGWRFMGQRFVPDSYVFQQLVFPAIQKYQGSGSAFTQGKNSRDFPRGLDIMSVLGSARAQELLAIGHDDAYENYAAQIKKLRAEFDVFPETTWEKNLYWAWLYALQPLLGPYDAQYPTWMQTPAWLDKSLTSALASWAQLRHDTILYAKQSYTLTKSAAPDFGRENQPVERGFVEPVVEFYQRLGTVVTLLYDGLEKHDLLDETSEHRLEQMSNVLEMLATIAAQEIIGEELTEEQYAFIDDIATNLKPLVAGIELKAQKTSIVADVHTDSNSGRVLEEATGNIAWLLVAYRLPDGTMQLGVGPVLTYYEFKHSMADRLTDEKWRVMLDQKPPVAPEWYHNFAV
jgi:hypothetical protein